MPILFVSLRRHLPMAAVMRNELRGVALAEHYILKGVTDALFLVFETTTYRMQSKTNAEVIATGWVICSP